jgi:tRNA nucleotidyltransferase (CCA-adding enzyme)
MTPRLWQQLRRVTRWINRFAWEQDCVPWQMRLEVILAAISPAQRQPIAAALQLTDSTIERLGNLDTLESTWLEQTSHQLPPSQLYQLFAPADLPTLLLVSARHPRSLGPLIWRHVTQWRSITPLIDGNQLKQLGYQPGPAFRTMLDHSLAAQIDGLIHTPAEATAFVTEQYPLFLPPKATQNRLK